VDSFSEFEMGGGTHHEHVCVCSGGYYLEKELCDIVISQ
jgi:hypothetical protein